MSIKLVRKFIKDLEGLNDESIISNKAKELRKDLLNSKLQVRTVRSYLSKARTEINKLIISNESKSKINDILHYQESIKPIEIKSTTRSIRVKLSSIASLKMCIELNDVKELKILNIILYILFVTGRKLNDLLTLENPLVVDRSGHLFSAENGIDNSYKINLLAELKLFLKLWERFDTEIRQQSKRLKTLEKNLTKLLKERFNNTVELIDLQKIYLIMSVQNKELNNVDEEIEYGKQLFGGKDKVIFETFSQLKLIM